MRVIGCLVRNNTLETLALLPHALDLAAAVRHLSLYVVWGHEMKITRILATAMLGAILAGSLGIGAGQAQIREQQPAEFPPSSYKGKQYVDSRGCVFIRAGIDGDVSWVPRVTRSRKTICGFKPSLPGQVATARAPVPTADQPVQITVNPAPAPSAVRPAPRRVAAPVVVRQTAPKPTRRVVKKAPVVVATAPQGRQTSCVGASALSQHYMRGDGRSAVRCGPQTAPIVGNDAIPHGAPRVAAILGEQRGTPIVTENTRIVPKHVAHNRINTRNVTVPKGYKRVWDDGRLNPYRAEQTLSGRTQMLLIWTQTVPRRLIDTRTGRDVTASIPVVYPYIDVITQNRELGKVKIVQRDGQIVKRIIRNPGSRKPVYSSRSAANAAATQPKASAPRALAGKRYVQIGTFGQTANAQKSAQRIARMGYPARIGKHRKGGKTYLTVQAGPFSDAGQLQRAFSKLRSAGYADAFVRK